MAVLVNSQPRLVVGRTGTGRLLVVVIDLSCRDDADADWGTEKAWTPPNRQPDGAALRQSQKATAAVVLLLIVMLVSFCLG